MFLFLLFCCFFLFFFFFQAEDGIRDHCVTGVQTCALPISPWPRRPRSDRGPREPRHGARSSLPASWSRPLRPSVPFPFGLALLEEGGDALLDVLGREGERELRAQV